MSESGRLGLLGGTFDPIHFGHVDAAEAARTALALDHVMLIPAHDPPHKPADPRATAFHRFALTALAVDEYPGFIASDIELTREGPSYTADTLRLLHGRGWQAWQLFFIVGADAFADIATWRDFPAVLNGAHFAVVARAGTAFEAAVARIPDLRPRVRRAGDPLPDPPHTAIFHVDARTRDVSSTTIRARLAARQPIDDLVPAAVARHIFAHHLYGAADHLHGEHQRN